MARIKYYDSVAQEWAYADMAVAIPPSRLPSAYQEVEYIKTSGTQYIDTGYVPKLTTRWEMVTQFVDGHDGSDIHCRNGKYGNGDRIAISCWDVLNNPEIELSIGAYQSVKISTACKIGSTTTNISIANQKTKYIIDVPNLIGEIPPYYTTSAFTAPTFTNTDTIFLNARNQGGGTYDGCGTQIIYSHKIWENGTKVQDFVPCYRIADNEIGMYDLVSKTFFTNDGTGTFIKGADV